MRARSLAIAAALGVALLAGCGESGSSDTTTEGGSGNQAQGCEPANSQELVVLADDKKLQTVDNVIPAINAEAATPPLIQALDKASAALTTDKLIAMNKQVVVERATSPNVAKEFASTEGLTSGVSGGSGKIIVGAANFAENQTLAGIYAEALNGAGFEASVKTIGNRELYEPALEKGEVQVVPEYVGTLTEFINKKVNGASAPAKASSDLDKTVTELTALGQQVGLRFGQPSEAADQNAFAVAKAFADNNGLKTLSDLAAKCNGGELVLGGPPECAERPFCQPGLEQTYGLKFTSFQALDVGGPLTKTALKQGRIQIGLVFSSDGELSASG